MQNIYRSLKKDQRKRGIVFSSTLSSSTKEQEGDLIHEVKGASDLADGLRVAEEIKRLKDVRFFQDSPWKYHIIRS